MLSFERASGGRQVRWWSLIGLFLVPIVVAGGFLWATWNSDARLGRVQAAVVNDDEPVTLNGQLVPLGRQLAGGLVASEEEQNFSWVLTDKDDAGDGLESGRYAAVVTIPENFSERATSFADTDAKAADLDPARIEVQTSQVSGIADPVVGQAISAAATKALNSQLTEEYLKNVYIGFNDTQKQFVKLADAAGQLSDGTGKLVKGLDQSAAGGGELASGLDRLGTGAQGLASGTGQLSSGTGQLADGLDQLAAGAKKSASGSRKLANGTDELASGATKLSKGAGKLAKGSDQLADGADQLAGGIHALHRGTTSQPGGTAAYADASADYAAGIEEYQSALKELAAAAKNNPSKLPAKLRCPAPADPPDLCDLYYGGMQAGLAAALSGLEDQGNSPGLVSGAGLLADGADAIDGGVAKLDTGAAKYADGADAFADGTHALAKGTRGLATGAGKLADGTDRLADGLGALATGAGKSASGAHQLASGASQLDDGARQLADGTVAAAGGAGQLSNGLNQLADGGGELASGSEKFADGLDKGKDQVPTYDADTRDKLAEVVATPVTTPKVQTVFSDVATTTFLAVIALWIGALASFLILRAVPSTVVSSSRPSWLIALRSMAPAAVMAALQSVVLTVMLQRLLDLDGAAVAALAPFMLLMAMTFVAVNYALVAWAGGIGRFVSVVMVVIAAAAGITSALPPAFDAIRPLLPLTPAMEGARAIVSGGPGAGGAGGTLLAWLIVGLVAAILAVARRRMVALAPMHTVAAPA